MSLTADLDLKDLVRTIPDYPKPGIMFRDITTLLGHANGFRACVERLAAPFTNRRVQAVAGIEARGFILGGAVADRLRCGFVPIRKKGKLPPPIVDRKYDLEYGSGVLEMQRGEGRLVLVDDVLATGGTLGASAMLATDAGFRVLYTGVLIDLGIRKDFRCLGEAPRAVIRYGD